MGIVKLFCDGSSRGNPGPGGYGTILQYTDNSGQVHEKELSQGYLETTNNRMELMGCIAGFEALLRPCRVEVYSDSKYLVDAFNEKWIDAWVRNGWSRGKSGPVKNIDLWKRLLSTMDGHEVSFCWVKGHDGHPENERCDRLATEAADSDGLIEDIAEE
ncbi:MAG: ribonuclease HI [Desulfovibrio sp.]|nr:ribonuclease HI [Desulfovibrio sp.]